MLHIFFFFCVLGLQRHCFLAVSSTVTREAGSLWWGLQLRTLFMMMFTRIWTSVRAIRIVVKCHPWFLSFVPAAYLSQDWYEHYLMDYYILLFFYCGTSTVGGLHRLPPEEQDLSKASSKGKRAGFHLGVTPAVLRARYNLTAADVGRAQNNSQAVAQVWPSRNMLTMKRKTVLRPYNPTQLGVIFFSLI